MGKAITVLLIIIFIIGFASASKKGSEEAPRVRVLANSNEVEDQAYKIEVVKALLSVLNKKEQTSYDFESLQSIKQELLKEVDHKDRIKVEYKKVAFPAKSYDGHFLPSGNYWTLLVTIGEGKGKNWWSVLYPEYFGLSFEDRMGFEDVEYRSYFYDKFTSNNEAKEDKP